MKAYVQSVALIASVLLCADSTAFAAEKTYTVSAYLTSGAINARAKVKKLVIVNGMPAYAQIGECNLSPTYITFWMPSPSPGSPFMIPFQMYSGHTGTFTTEEPAYNASVQYEEPIGNFHYGTATVTAPQ